MGGGALLLLGLGGTALMRRRRDDEAMVADPQIEPAVVPVAMPATEPAYQPVRPAMAPAMPLAASDATLEAMVAALPSTDNPFTTRTKRMRRAKFILASHAPAPAPQTMHAEPVAAPAPDRSQTVYRFGGQVPHPGFLKPRTR
jgi:cell wall-associated NlpC family hydrolase